VSASLPVPVFTGSWIGPRSGLDVVAMEKVFALSGNETPAVLRDVGFCLHIWNKTLNDTGVYRPGCLS